jgi:hypothetical protein
MSHWPSTQASRVLSALHRIGWQIKRTTGSFTELVGLTLCSPFMTVTKSVPACWLVFQR